MQIKHRCPPQPYYPITVTLSQPSITADYRMDKSRGSLINKSHDADITAELDLAQN